MASIIIIPAQALSPLWISGLLETDQNITDAQNPLSSSHFLSDLAISDDGKTIAAGTYDGSIYYMNETGAVLWNRSMCYDIFYINSFSLSSDGNYLAVSDSGSAPASNPMKRMNLINNSGETLWNYSARTFVFYSAISSNGSCSVFGSYDNIRCFDKNGSSLWNYPVNAPVTSLDISEDGEYTLAVLGHKLVICLNMSGSVLWEHDFHAVNDMKICGDGNYICLSSTSLRKLYFLNNKGAILWNRTLPHTGIMCDLSYTGDIIVVRTTGGVYSYDQSGKFRWQYNSEYPQSSVHPSSPPVISLSKDGRYTVFVSGQSFILLNETGSKTGNFSCEDPISGVDISSDDGDIVAITNKCLYFFENPVSSSNSFVLEDKESNSTDPVDFLRFYGNLSHVSNQLLEVK
ncbi:MAG: PQQ-binding-like beta-propeller repeat protein [Methanogenium sp.]|nr:PQQ-binding-like beta-propeller repeat protein [Methanogenium sp.]